MGLEQMHTMKFDALLDIDRQEWFKKATDEAQLIYQSARGREIGEVMEKCIYSSAPEQWLIEKRGYSNDPRAYKDVVAPNGVGVEVKTTSKETYVPHVLNRANNAAAQKWRQMEKRLYIFIGCPQTYKYEFHSIHEWDADIKQFITSI